MKKPNVRVLCLFDYYCTTGFATVSTNIVDELKRHFGERLTLHIFAVNYFGAVATPDAYTTVIPASKVGLKPDAFGRYEFLATLKANEYDAIFMIQDIGVIAPFIEHLRHIKNVKAEGGKKTFKTIFYFPVDNAHYLKRWFDDFSFLETIVTYTDYGKREIVKRREELKPKIKVIPHGTNEKHFYPLDKKIIAEKRKDYFGKHADKFIITCVNRNQPRKDIPNTILSFKHYRDNYNKNSVLYLHMNALDEMGWNLKVILEQLDLVPGEDVLFPPEGLEDAGAKISLMNEIYNTSDMYLTTTTGEGWGLGITEAMMCKLPVLAPNNTSIIEMGDNGQRIFTLEETYPYCATYDSIMREQSNYVEVAEKIDHIKNHPEEVAVKTQTAYDYARTLSWENVCKKWIELFETLY